MKVKGNTTFVELFIVIYPFDMLICTHSWSGPRFLVFFVCMDFLLLALAYINQYKRPGHPTTEQNTPGLEALICCATQKRSKKHRQTIGKAKRKAKYVDIVLKRLNAVIRNFQSLITHDWTRLKILRNGSHYRANNIVLATTQMLLAGDWTSGECRRYIKQHVLLSDRSSKWLSFIRLMIKSTDSCNV